MVLYAAAGERWKSTILAAVNQYSEKKKILNYHKSMLIREKPKLFILKAVLTILRDFIETFVLYQKTQQKKELPSLTRPQKATFIFTYKTSTMR
jgi:hypothetical protein